MSKRSRFDVSAEDLADRLQPVVASLGKCWLRYDESKKVTEAKVLPSEILQARPILQVLYEANPRLAFVRSTVFASIGILMQQFEAD